MAGRLNVDAESLLSTLKATVCKGCTDPEVMAFSIVANEYNLNPFIKHIYAFPAKGGGIVPVVSVDGWITMTNNHPQMDGIEFEDFHDEKGNLISIACSVFRKDRNRPIKITEYLDECKRPTDPWKMPHRMLRHKALIQCARVAFGFSGVIDEDEADDIARNGGMRETNGRVVGSENPYGPAEPAATAPKPEPKGSTKPATKQAPVATTEIATAEVVTEETYQPEAAVERPSYEDMIADIREACAERKIATAEATRLYRVAGAIPKGKKFADLTEDEIFEVWKVRGDALDQPATGTEGGAN